MSLSKIHGTFVSEKINKIRWRPDPFNNPHFFISGSWDQEQNTIKLWDFQENDDLEIYPYEICSYDYSGDITEAQFINQDNFVTASSNGSVDLFKINYDEKDEISLLNVKNWKNIHNFTNGDSCACTSLATYDTDIVSIGEDGRINLLTLSSESVVRSLDNADSCTLRCVIFLKHNEILTSNSRGHMKIWDLRCREEEPLSTFILSSEMVAPTCLAYHPTQRHLVIAGDEEGSLTIWDLRQNTFPINYLNAHAESVTELQFHPDYPDHLFSASLAGDLWHWYPKQKAGNTLLPGIKRNDDLDSNVWLGSDNFKNKLEVYTLVNGLHKPVNSFHVSNNKVLCGCDNEAIYLLNDVKMYNY